MTCLPNVIRSILQRQPFERPVCVPNAPLLDVGTDGVSAPLVFADLCTQASQAFRPSSVLVSADMQSSTVPYPEFDTTLTGGRYVNAEYSGSFFVQGALY